MVHDDHGHDDMNSTIHTSCRLSSLALLCACAILLAWATPAINAMADDSLSLLRLQQNHPVSDLAVEQSETADAADDPVLLSSSRYPDLHPLMSLLHVVPLTRQIWSPTPPVRPPVIHA
jgi:hypothetical protein